MILVNYHAENGMKGNKQTPLIWNESWEGLSAKSTNRHLLSRSIPTYVYICIIPNTYIYVLHLILFTIKNPRVNILQFNLK